MKDNCNELIKKVLALCGEMLRLADEGDANRRDIGCGVLFGMLRDNAYKMRTLAESEINEHQLKNKNDQSTTFVKKDIL